MDFDWTQSGELTFAVSLVHDLQVRVSHAAGHQQGALVLVRLPVTAANGVLPGNVGAVRGAHALGPPHLHFANLPRAAFDSLACVWMEKRSEGERRSSVTVLARLQTSGDPTGIFTQSCSSEGGGGFSPDRDTRLTWHNIYSHHISLLTVTQRGVSLCGMWL